MSGQGAPGLYAARLERPGARPQEHYLLLRCNRYDNQAETSCTSYSRIFFL